MVFYEHWLVIYEFLRIRLNGMKFDTFLEQFLEFKNGL